MSKFQSPWPKRLLYTLLTLCGLYLLTGFLLVPALATFLAPRLAKDHLEGRLETGWIGFNPFTFKVSLPEVSWTGPDGESLAGFDRLEINADPMASLFNREWRVAGISLEGAFVEVTVNEDASLNLLNALAKRPDDPETADAEAESTLPPAWLGLLEVTDLTVRLTDLRREQAFHKVIAPIDFRLADLRTGPGRESPYSFTAITGASESIALEGQLQLQPLLLTGELTGRDILISEYAFYLSNLGQINLQSGRLDLDLPFSVGLRDATAYAALAMGRVELTQLKAALSGASPVALSLRNLFLEEIDIDVALDPEDGFSAGAGARLELNRFEAKTANAEQPLATFEALIAEDVKVSLLPLALSASRITWSQPDLFLERDSAGTFTLLTLLGDLEGEAVVPPEAEPAGDEAAPGSLPAIQIDRFAINEGRIRFKDASVDPVAAFALNPVDLVVEPVSLDPEKVSRAVLDATFEKSARIQLSGNLYLGNPFSDTEAEMSIKDVPLSVSTPYTLKFMGQPISEGTFSGDFTYDLTDKSLTASNALVVDSIAFGDVPSDYEGKTYPVGIAIALLQNNQKEIAIDIPVSGSLEDPTFHPAGVIRSVVAGLLTQAITSPFNLVAAMTGSVVSGVAAVAQAESSETDYSRITFPAGRFNIEESAVPVLETVADMLDSRPRIRLGIQGSVDAQADLVVLKEERFNEQLAEVEGADHSDKLRRAYILEILERDPDLSEKAVASSPETAEVLPETEATEPVIAPEPSITMEPAVIPDPEKTMEGTKPEPVPEADLEPSPQEGKTGLTVTRRGLRKFSRPTAFIERETENSGAPSEASTVTSTPSVDEPDSVEPSTNEEPNTSLVADAGQDPPQEATPEPEAVAPVPLPELPSDKAMAEALENHWFDEPPDLDRLARQRATSVRDYFIGTGKINPERLDLSEPFIEDGAKVDFILKPE